MGASALSGVKLKSMSICRTFPPKIAAFNQKRPILWAMYKTCLKDFDLSLSCKPTRISLAAIFARIFIKSRQYIAKSLV